MPVSSLSKDLSVNSNFDSSFDLNKRDRSSLSEL